MSKSDPSSAIFMEDTEHDVKSKIKGAFCPPQQLEGNPCLAYVKHVVMPWVGHVEVHRSEDNGGNRKYGSYEELEEEYGAGRLHPGGLGFGVCDGAGVGLGLGKRMVLAMG